MGKLLRVLVIFLFILSGAALTLGILLFEKRELLKGRTQKLEIQLRALSEAFIEDKQANSEENTFVAKDIDECTSTPNDNPGKSTFWDTYKVQFEKQDLDKMQVSDQSRLCQLATYYLRDKVETYLLTGTFKVKKDMYGKAITEGPGTMQELLNEVLDKASTQYARLNGTRQQLTELREELIKTIEELNQRKRTLREKLALIVELRKEIAQLKAEIERLKQKIAELEEEKRALEEKVAEQERKITELEEQKIELKATIEELKKEITRLREIGEKPVEEPGKVSVRLEPGPKGKVASINTQWNFVIMELSDECLAELNKFKGAWPPPAELMIKRADKDQFVTKVRLIQVKRSRKLAIGDILTDWQQEPVKPGDVVFF